MYVYYLINGRIFFHVFGLYFNHSSIVNYFDVLVQDSL